jgi:pimeloyl-ACP methyl ester carboxylesterase
MAVRWTRARRLAHRMSGSAPAVRTDDGVRLHVEVDGRADAPVTIVFAHGFAARSAIFDSQWTALRGRARLIRYDQRGHGASGWAGVRSATVDRLGRDLGEVVDALTGDGPVVVVGHSMGGMAVLALADQRPELFGARITGVALLSTRAAPLPWAGSSTGPLAQVPTTLSAAGAWLLWMAAPVVGALRPFRSWPGRRVLRRRLFAGDPPDRAVHAMAGMWTDTPSAVMTAYLISLASYDERAAVDALRAVPVLILAGTDDATIPASSAQRLAEQIGEQAELLLVDGAGHMVNVAHSSTVNAALERLLTRAQVGPTDGSTP